MKILYDHQIFTSQKYGGISRYFYELIRELDNISEVEYEIPLLVSNNHYISDKRFVDYIELLPNKQFRGKHRIFKFLNKLNKSFWNKLVCSVYHKLYAQILVMKSK